MGGAVLGALFPVPEVRSGIRRRRSKLGRYQGAATANAARQSRPRLSRPRRRLESGRQARATPRATRMPGTKAIVIVRAKSIAPIAPPRRSPSRSAAVARLAAARRRRRRAVPRQEGRRRTAARSWPPPAWRRRRSQRGRRRRGPASRSPIPYTATVSRTRKKASTDESLQRASGRSRAATEVIAGARGAYGAWSSTASAQPSIPFGLEPDPVVFGDRQVAGLVDLERVAETALMRPQSVATASTRRGQTTSEQPAMCTPPTPSSGRIQCQDPDVRGAVSRDSPGCRRKGALRPAEDPEQGRGHVAGGDIRC